MNILRPTLAVGIDTEEQLAEVLKKHGCLWMSEKKDGIRAISSSGKLWSREGKLIPNKHLQNFFRFLPPDLDGELMFHIDEKAIHPPLEHINSIVTSDNTLWPNRWTPKFYVFDIQDSGYMPYHARYSFLQDYLHKTSNDVSKIILVKQIPVTCMRETLPFFRNIVNYGGEGICLRNPEARYKQGRSTLNDGALMRFKRIIQGVATITKLTNLLKHKGIQDRNAFGLAKRDSKLSNLQAQNELGALIGYSREFGNIKVGSGFTADERLQYFDNNLIGCDFVYEYRDLTHKGVPRNPTFVKLLPTRL